MSSASASMTSASGRMSGPEPCAAASLASIFTLYILGLLMIVPVLAVFAKTLPNGNNTRLVAFAIGVYGLTQAVFCIPYSQLSDRFGRKSATVARLVTPAVGSLVAAFSHSVTGIAVGRVIQGVGAISSVVIAFVADLTCEKHRTKAMVIVEDDTGSLFTAAVVNVPVILRWVGMSGMSTAIDVLAVVAIGMVLWAVPNPSRLPEHVKVPSCETLRYPELLRLNFDMFALHATQTALSIMLLHMLEVAGLSVNSYWEIYLPAMGASFVLTVPAIITAEKRGKMKAVLLSAVALVIVTQLALGEADPILTALAIALLVYLLGFNMLEASQPSLVSKHTPSMRKGATMGVYSMTRALGLFADGAGGGWILLRAGQHVVFLTYTALAFAWLIIASPTRMPALRRH